MDYFIGIDVGSSSVRGGLFDSEGGIHSHAKKNIKVWNPHPDFYEHSTTDIWCGVTEVIQVSVMRFSS